MSSTARRMVEWADGVLFDFDDTLMATRARRVHLLIEACRFFDCIVDSEDVQRHWGKPFKQLVTLLAPSVDYDQFLTYYSELMKGHPPETLPGVVALLWKLHRRGAVSAVVSSSSHMLVEQDLRSRGLLGYVWRIWGFEDTSSHKPDIEVLHPVLEALEAGGFDRNGLVYIGDSEADLTVARGNGVPFVAVLTGTAGRGEFRSRGLADDCIVTSLEEVLTS